MIIFAFFLENDEKKRNLHNEPRKGASNVKLKCSSPRGYEKREREKTRRREKTTKQTEVKLGRIIERKRDQLALLERESNDDFLVDGILKLKIGPRKKIDSCVIS